jgi:putative aldouronate transport system permease protein
MAEKYAAQGNLKMVRFFNYVPSFFVSFVLNGIPALLIVVYGKAVGDALAAMPQWIMDGFALAGGILPALGIGMLLNFMGLIAGFPVPIILALLLNELRFERFKKVSQTVLYLPHFLSWVIIASVALSLFKPETGLVNILLRNMGAIDKGIPFLTEKWHWAVTYLLIGVWQNMGWGSIIYLAAITGISPDLYEAATIDGAGRWRKIWNVTLPGIRGTMVTLLIMNLGRVMGSNFERLDSFGNVQVKDFQYQLAIYIYEKGLAGSNFSRATAVGLFQSLVGLILVLVADRVTKALGEDGLL